MNITNHNYEEYLIDYLHGELKGDLLVEMEVFLSANPAVKEEYELLKDTIITPDLSIVFEDKKSLLKEEKVVGFTPTYKKYFAIAASLIGIMLALYFLLLHDAKPDIVIHHPIENTGDTSVVQHDTNRVNQKINKPSIQHPLKNSLTQNKVMPHPSQSPKMNRVVIKDTVVSKNNLPFENSSVEIVKHENQIIVPEKKEKEVIVKQNEMPVIENKKEEELAANNLTPKQSPMAIELNSEKQPRLFKLIQGISKLKSDIKKAKQQITNTEVLVMVGNTKIINLN